MNFMSVEMWVVSQEFWAGLMLPFCIAVVFLCFKSTRENIDRKLIGQMAVISVAMLAIHLRGWSYNWIDYGNFVNAHIIPVPILWAAVIKRQTIEAKSAYVMSFATFLVVDVLCAIYFVLTNGYNLFYVTGIGAGGKFGFPGFDDGLLMFSTTVFFLINVINFAHKRANVVTPELAK